MKRILLFLLPLCLMACHRGRTYFPAESKMEPVTVDFVRFDQALMNVSRSTAMQDIQLLYHEYPDFMPYFVEDILGIPTTDTAYLCQVLPDFLEDTVYGFHATNMLEKQVFADISDIEKPINKAFTRIKYLYPELIQPTLYLYISGFNSSILFFSDDIAIGADMYLGSDYEYYNRVVYDYQKLTMRKECIPADVISAYLFHNLPYTSTNSRLIDNMLYRGKIMYLLSLLLPDEKPWDIMGYTKQQWDWCLRYERAIWNRMMDKRDLFKTESVVLTSYLNDGPFTAEISQEAPARLGTWIGWRIAESYMNHNTDVTLQQLMAEPNAEHILEYSYYRP